MFSGKTEELIRRLMRAKQMGKSVEVFKPHIDTRYAKSEVVSHAGLRIPARMVDTLPSFTSGSIPEVVGIDEAQFFGEPVVKVVEFLVQCGSRVVVSGLDLTYQGQPFHPMPHLLALADEVTKLRAVCARCLAEASRSFRLAPVLQGEPVNETNPIFVGGAESYEPRCVPCFTKG
jgi:thymidine kinase